jgi:hypothetical protein
VLRPRQETAGQENSREPLALRPGHHTLASRELPALARSPARPLARPLARRWVPALGPVVALTLLQYMYVIIERMFPEGTPRDCGTLGLVPSER